jgi:DNA-directed RNA polymerase subunit RPC12/RpoP
LQQSRTRPPLLRRDTTKGRVYRSTPPYLSYTCSLCGYHQALPYSVRGYRCPADGRYLRRDRTSELYLTHRKEGGLELSLSSP